MAGLLLWVWPSAGKANLALTIAVNGGLVLWTVDEIVRGVNPWRRSLGAVVLLYEFTTLFKRRQRFRTREREPDVAAGLYCNGASRAREAVAVGTAGRLSDPHVQNSADNK